jgi:hypothetical protein
MMSHGFPNQFFTGFTQAGVSANRTASGRLSRRLLQMPKIVSPTLTL